MTQQSATGDHGALMDAVYRRQRHIYDFTRKYYLFGRDRLIRELALRPGETLIEIGCGTARNLVKIARLYPEAQLFGLDASAEMLKSAADSLARENLTGRVKLAHGFAETLSPQMFDENRKFDRAVFSYSLSMIPDWRAALAAAGVSLSENGKIHVVDFGDLAGLGSVGAKALRAWLRLFHVEPRVEILQDLEGAAAPGNPRQLWISPGRYAFLWAADRRQAIEFKA